MNKENIKMIVIIASITILVIAAIVIGVIVNNKSNNEPANSSFIKLDNKEDNTYTQSISGYIEK